MFLNNKVVIGYHFVGETLRDGSPVPQDGVWLHYEGDIKLFVAGYHGSLHPFDALQYAPGNMLCLCEFSGEIKHWHDKLVARSRKIIKRLNAEQLLRGFARECALSVVHLWDCPAGVRTYLEKGDGSVREAALDAARSAEAAACAAAEAAARATAWAAARAAHKDRFSALVNKEFSEVV
jgi:hypothetical protein